MAQETPMKEMAEEQGPTVVVVDDENKNNNNSGAAAATGGCAACACCLTCMGFFFGIPMIIVGAIFVGPILSWLSWSVGVGATLIVLGLLFFVGAIAACVVTGKCAKKAGETQGQVAPAPGVIIVQAPVQQPMQPMQMQQQPMQPVQQPGEQPTSMVQPGQPDEPPAYVPTDVEVKSA